MNEELIGLFNKIDKSNKNESQITIDRYFDRIIEIVNEEPKHFVEVFEIIKTYNKKRFQYFDFNKDNIERFKNVLAYLATNNISIISLYDFDEYPVPKSIGTYEVSPEDDNFMKTHSIATANDIETPIFLFTNFNKFGACSTNGMFLIFTPYKKSDTRIEGNFCYTKKCFENKNSGKLEYVNYQKVIPEGNFTTESIFDGKRLYSVLKNIVNQDISTVGNKVRIFSLTNGNQYIGEVDVNIFISGLEILFRLGINDFKLRTKSEPNQPAALLISEIDAQSDDILNLEKTFLILMPIFKRDYENVISFDIKNSEVYYPDEPNQRKKIGGNSTPKKPSINKIQILIKQLELELEIA